MISHEHRMIFVHVRKTGGVSIERAFGIGWEFSNPEAPDDWRHAPLSFYRTRFPEEFRRYFKFAFVRNPWDRQVSLFAMNADAAERKKREVGDPLDPKFARKLARMADRFAVRRSPEAFRQALLGPQPHWMARQLLDWRDGTDMAPDFDFIGRFESLREDFEKICSTLGIEAALPHENRSSHAPYWIYYDEPTRAVVAERSAHDIEHFGYTFGPLAAPVDV